MKINDEHIAPLIWSEKNTAVIQADVLGKTINITKCRDDLFSVALLVGPAWQIIYSAKTQDEAKSFVDGFYVASFNIKEAML